MHHATRSKRLIVALSGAGLVAASMLAGPASASVAADEPTSTPVPIATPEGQLMSYIVNAKHANAGQTRLVESAVKAAGGEVVQSWPQIGVVVAHSTKADFRADVVELDSGHAVDSVGASRTAAVSEGTPGTGGATANGQLSVGGWLAGQDVTAAEAVTLDPREGEQWDMTQIKADKAHEITDGSSDVLVGVLDSGIDSTHPDLAPNVDLANSVNCTDAGRPDTAAGAAEPTTSAHGTHVAGTIAAARNGVGIVGVAPGVTMASVKVVNDDGYIYPEYAVCGFVWAAEHGMDVTNNSYYVDPFEFWCDDQPDQHAAKEAVRRAVTFSTKKGVVHAAAAGNAAYDLANKTTNTSSPNDGTAVNRTLNSTCHDIPTELDGVVTTSSITQAGTLSSFSNRGLGVIDVAAPGSAILSTVPGGYALFSGTSMASPHAAGVLALLKSTHPDATPAQLIDMLRAQATDTACSTTTRGAACVGPVEDNSYFGEGVIDALAAVS
ncbi:S8 family peptidase [Janibacter sp. G56]|uniref:S8 family peptidase n=1 Tax=Janibacter sp. G56 TaxID=3418717 RepID=UPI003D038B7E